MKAFLRIQKPIALVLLFAFGFWILGQESALADGGGWAARAVEKVVAAIKAVGTAIAGFFKNAAEWAGRRPPDALKEPNVDAVKALVDHDYNKANSSAYWWFDSLKRYFDTARYGKKRAEQLAEEGKSQKAKAAAEKEAWEKKVDELFAKERQVKARVDEALAMDIPPACSWMQEQVKEARERVEKFWGRYVKANRTVRASAVIAMNRWWNLALAWGAFVTGAVILWSNIVTILLSITKAIRAVKTLLTNAKAAITSGLSFLKLAKDTFVKYWQEFQKLLASRQALEAFFRSTWARFTSLIESLASRALNILNTVVNKIGEIAEALKRFDFGRAAEIVKELYNYVKEGLGLGSQAEQAAAQAEVEAQSITQKAKELYEKFDSATSRGASAYNHVDKGEQAVRKAIQQAKEAGTQGESTAKTVARSLDNFFLGIQEYEKQKQALYKDMDKISTAVSDYEFGLIQMQTAESDLGVAIAELKLFQLRAKKCLRSE